MTNDDDENRDDDDESWKVVFSDSTHTHTSKSLTMVLGGRRVMIDSCVLIIIRDSFVRLRARSWLHVRRDRSL
jgi:hypothetical protein